MYEASHIHFLYSRPYRFLKGSRTNLEMVFIYLSFSAIGVFFFIELDYLDNIFKYLLILGKLFI